MKGAEAKAKASTANSVQTLVQKRWTTSPEKMELLRLETCWRAVLLCMSSLRTYWPLASKTSGDVVPAHILTPDMHLNNLDLKCQRKI